MTLERWPVVLCGLLLLNLAASLVAPNVVESASATVLLVTALVLLIRLDPVAMSLLMPYALLQLSMLVSLNAIEAGSAMPEMGVVGTMSTASTSYVACSLLFDVAGVLAFARTGRGPQRAPEQSGVRAGEVFCQTMFLGATTLEILYLLSVGVRTGFPLLTGTDRFVFKRFSADPITIDFLDLKLISTAALGTCAAFGATRAIRYSSHLLLTAMIGVSFLFGDKFFIILVALMAFVAPFVIRAPEHAVPTLIRLLPVVLLAGAMVCSITLYIYSDGGTKDFGDAVQRFADRTSGQAQLWYLAVRDYSAWINFDGSAIRGSLASMLARNPADYFFSHTLGPFFFVDRYAPPAMYRSVMHNAGSTTPTEAFEAYGLVMLGYVGLAVQIAISGAVAGLIGRLQLHAIRSRNPLHVFLPAFMTVAMLKLVAQGTIYSILSVNTFKFYALFGGMSVAIWSVSRLAPQRPCRINPA